MTSRIFDIFVVVIVWLTTVTAFAETKSIKSAKAEFDVVANKDIEKSANKYLERYVNLEGTPSNRRLAEDFLRSLYIVMEVQCKYHDEADGRNLLCEITSKRTVRKISVIHLPASLLEDELKRRLPIEIGQTIEVDNTIDELLSVLRNRVETFLRKNGYYDAIVKVTHNSPNDKPWTDFTIEIVNGVFVRVQSVTVSGDSPIPASSIRKQFSRMCFSFNRIIESVSMGTLSCYSRELERETIQSLQDRLAKLGYVQSQIRVSHYWINPKDKDAPKICREIDGKPPAFRCINLRVNVDKGPKFRWKVNLKDRISISRHAVERFIASIFSVDQLSRVSTSSESDEIALDHAIIEQEMEEKITFISSKNVDEQELSESAEEITNFLVSRGYTNAEVIPNLVQEDEDNILVTFDVYADRPYFVESVRVLPDKYGTYFNAEKLNDLVPVRSFTANGSLSYVMIDNAKNELIDHLKKKGFSNLTVITDMEMLSNGSVSVVFNVRGSEREIVDEIIVINGLTSLNDDILPNLHNCDNFLPRGRRRESNRCYQSSFVSEKIDEDRSKLSDHYQTSGYLYAEVTSEVVKSPRGNTIIFTIFDSRLGEKSMEPLRRQTINDLIISGNSKTSSAAIRRLFPRERRTSTFDPIALKKGIASLREAGRFARIDHKIMFGQENGDDAYFLLQLAERPSLSLDASIAFSTDQHFSFETELEEANLFASMLKLNTTLSLGLFWGRQSIFSNKLVWPYILGKPLRLTVYAPIIVYEDRLHLSTPSRRLQSKLSLRLDWRLSSRITPYLEYWLVFTQKDDFTGKPLPPTDASLSVRSLDGLIPTLRIEPKIQGVLKPGISFIQVDNPFDPHSGIDVNLWTELSGGPLLGRPPFINLGVQNRFYIPFGPLTLALQATFMRAFLEPSETNFTSLRDVSYMDKLGGDRSVRGYEQDKIGIAAFSGRATKYAGYFSNIANAELRFPLTSKSAVGNFSGAIFVDEGMVIPCGSLFTCGAHRSLKSLAAHYGLGLSVGAALRYSLPVGPISLDYGISPLTGDNRVHILFGYSF